MGSIIDTRRRDTITNARNKGEGHLFKRGKVYYLQYDVAGKRKVVSLGTSRLRSLLDQNGTIIDCGAEDKARKLLTNRDAKTTEALLQHIGEAKGLLSSHPLTLAEAWPRFVRRYRKKKTGSATLANYKQQWDRFVQWLNDERPSIKKLRDVTDRVAEAYLDHLEHDRKLASSTYNQHRGTCRLVFAKLQSDIETISNPWDQTERMESDGVTREELDEAELTKLLAVFADPKLKVPHKAELEVLFHIGAWTGLRLKDAVLLEWESVGFPKNQIECVPYKTRRHETSVRIPLHPMLRNHLEGALSWKTNSYVLPNQSAQYLRYKPTLIRHTVQVFRCAGFETTEHVEGRNQPTSVRGFHSLRHSFVSFCANAGVPLTSVQVIIGHSSPAMTAHYAHIDPGMAQQAIDALPLLGTSTQPANGADDSERAELRRLADTLPLGQVKKLLALAKAEAITSRVLTS